MGIQVISQLPHQFFRFLIGNCANIHFHRSTLGHASNRIDFPEVQSLNIHRRLCVQLFFQSITGKITDKMIDAIHLLHGLFIIVIIQDKIALILSQGSNAVIKMVYGNIVICILHGIQRPNKSPYRIAVILGFLTDNLKRGNALNAHVHYKRAIDHLASTFPDDTIRLDLFRIIPNEVHQMRRSNLLFAFRHKFNVDRELS